MHCTDRRTGHTSTRTHVRSRSDRRRGALMLFIPAIRYHLARSPHFRRMPASPATFRGGQLSLGRERPPDRLRRSTSKFTCTSERVPTFGYHDTCLQTLERRWIKSSDAMERRTIVNIVLKLGNVNIFTNYFKVELRDFVIESEICYHQI